jgi:hypothetical protein
MLDADADKVRHRLGEPAVARLSDQLDRLAGRLSEFLLRVSRAPP